jgi:hypothetical protein
MKAAMPRPLSLLLITLGLALSGCWATTDTPARWKQLPPEQASSVFGTITAEMGGPSGPLSRYMIHFRNIDTREESFLSVNPGMDSSGDPELYERRRTSGAFFDITLPPGRYEFYDVWMVAATGFGSTEYRSREPFSVPFTIEPGKTHYIGEIRAYPVVGRNVFGMSLAAGGYFVLRDQEARDTRILLKRRAVPAVAPVRNLVREIDTNRTPFLRASPQPPFDTPPAS